MITVIIGIQLCPAVDKGFRVYYLISPRDTLGKGGQATQLGVGELSRGPAGVGGPTVDSVQRELQPGTRPEPGKKNKSSQDK